VRGCGKRTRGGLRFALSAERGGESEGSAKRSGWERWSGRGRGKGGERGRERGRVVGGETEKNRRLQLRYDHDHRYDLSQCTHTQGAIICGILACRVLGGRLNIEQGCIQDRQDNNVRYMLDSYRVDPNMQ
jgi:hypothetical protein